MCTRMNYNKYYTKYGILIVNGWHIPFINIVSFVTIFVVIRPKILERIKPVDNFARCNGVFCWFSLTVNWMLICGIPLL